MWMAYFDQEGQWTASRELLNLEPSPGTWGQRADPRLAAPGAATAAGWGPRSGALCLSSSPSSSWLSLGRDNKGRHITCLTKKRSIPLKQEESHFKNVLLYFSNYKIHTYLKSWKLQKKTTQEIKLCIILPLNSLVIHTHFFFFTK